jgi:hypothetical protein
VHCHWWNTSTPWSTFTYFLHERLFFGTSTNISLHFENQGQSSEEIKIFKANLETAMTNFQFHGTSIDTHQSTSMKPEETTPLIGFLIRVPDRTLDLLG